MKVVCLNNTGESLRPFENKTLKKEEIGRFGATGYTQFNEIKIGREYLVMGMIMFESYLGYLIDDDGFITTSPCQLFEVVDSTLTSNWHFRLIGKGESIYPFIQAVWGYYEFCFDKEAYEKLVIDGEEEAQMTYFRRKLELEKSLIST